MVDARRNWAEGERDLSESEGMEFTGGDAVASWAATASRLRPTRCPAEGAKTDALIIGAIVVVELCWLVLLAYVASLL